MAQPHKGDRVQIGTRPARDVYDAIKAESCKRGISMGQFVADVLAIHMGLPEFVRELNREQDGKLPMAM